MNSKMEVSENYYVDEKGKLRYDNGFYTSCELPEWQALNVHKEVTGVLITLDIDTDEGINDFIETHELNLDYILFLNTK